MYSPVKRRPFVMPALLPVVLLSILKPGKAQSSPSTRHDLRLARKPGSHEIREAERPANGSEVALAALLHVKLFL